MRRLPLHVIVAFLAVHVIAFDVLVRSLGSGGHVGRFVTAAAALGLAVGATAGLRAKTWGVGLMLASATSFFVAGALEMGPSFFYVVAAVGAFPFFLTARYMARFDLGATLAFALLSGAVGVGSAFAWNLAAPTIIPMFPR
ncbi:MAG: hypothetical protein HOO96_09060 [Polyangiaceae bacterium]|nr:hypothetical protein [Polyangiaceae bacterium]